MFQRWGDPRHIVLRYLYTPPSDLATCLYLATYSALSHFREIPQGRVPDRSVDNLVPYLRRRDGAAHDSSRRLHMNPNRFPMLLHIGVTIFCIIAVLFFCFTH